MLTSHLYFSLIVANLSYTSVSWVVIFEICSVIFVLSKHMFHSALIMCTVPILTTVSKIQTLSFLFSHFTLCKTLGQFSFSTLMFLSALSVVYFVPQHMNLFFLFLFTYLYLKYGNLDISLTIFLVFILLVTCELSPFLSSRTRQFFFLRASHTSLSFRHPACWSLLRSC